MAEAMTPPSTPAQMLDWGVAAAPLPGETSSGDLHVVQPFDRGVLVAALDALGHGDAAADAARIGAAILSQYAGEPLPQLVQRCHEALVRTRGVVMSLASFDRIDRTMTWLGVGDVEGDLIFGDPDARPWRTGLVTRGGIVGERLPVTSPWVIPVSPGDTVIFATDGVRSGYVNGMAPRGSPQQIADHILARYKKDTDDALVLVARYVGESGPAR